MISIGFVLPACGHWLYAAEQVGLDLRWVYEPNKWEKRCCVINYPNLNYLGKNDDYLNVDVIVGSPPCKGFSSAAGGQRSKKNQSQNFRIVEYASIIFKVKPKIFIMENVPLIIKRGKKELDEQLNYFSGYLVKDLMLTSSNYGSSQKRKRFFRIGIREDLQIDYLDLIPERDLSVTIFGVIKDIFDKPRDGTYHKHHICFNGKVHGFMKLAKLEVPLEGKFPTIHGRAYLYKHPNQVRYSILELQRIIGLPDNWKYPTKAFDRKVEFIAEGIDISMVMKLLNNVKVALL